MPTDRASDGQLASDDFREFLRRVGDKQPVVLLLDDVQWIDSDSAALLAHAFAGPIPPALLVVGALRRDDAERAHLRGFESSLSNHTLARVHLGPLPPGDSRELVRALRRGKAPIDKVTATRLARLSGGVPFFAEMLVDAPDRLVADSAANLESVLQARRRGLQLVPRRALELLCVASRPLPLELLLQVAGARGDIRALDPLLQGRLARLVYLEGISSVEPYHARIRDSIRRTLGRKVVTAHHRRLARALRGRAGPTSRLRSRRLAGCGQTQAAAALALGAAEAANQQLAFDRAAALFGVVLTSGWHASSGRRSAAAGARVRSCGAQAGSWCGVAPGREHHDQSGTGKRLVSASGDASFGLRRRRGGPTGAGFGAGGGEPSAAAGSRPDRRGDRSSVAGTRGPRADPGVGRPPPTPDALARIDLLLDLALGLAHVDLRALPFACQAFHAALDAGEPLRLHRAAALFIVNTVEYVPTPLVRPTLELCRRLTEQIGEPYAAPFTTRRSPRTRTSTGTSWRRRGPSSARSGR